MQQPFDVIIIGAGQQGLALGKMLQDKGCSLLLLEANKEVGKRWEEHYDSLELFTPRRYSALPGLLLPGDLNGYATKDEFAAYLRDYADHFHLPIQTSAQVTRVSKEGEVFAVETNEAVYTARAVVVATGYTKPIVPATQFIGFAIHSSAYKNPAQIPPKKVLVVGNGNSAAQIALELSASHCVHIAMREMPRMIPRTVFGKSFYWWNEILGVHNIASDSFLGTLFRREKDYVVGNKLARALTHRALIRTSGLQEASGSLVTFDDGSTEKYDAIIFATGFTSDYSWLDIPNSTMHNRGVSVVPGLFFAGLRNQITGVSSNIYGVQAVSAHLLQKICENPIFPSTRVAQGI